MIFTLAEIPDEDAVNRLRQLALNPGPLEYRLAATVAMRWRGNITDAQLLKTAAASTKDLRIKQHWQLAAEAIEYRLTQIPDSITATEWATYQRHFWPDVITPPPFRSIDTAYREAARRIVRKGKLPSIFLQRFNDREIESAQIVAVQIMGLQKQVDEVQHFYNLALRPDSLGRAGLNALVEVGNEAAVRLLGELLTKKGFSWPSVAVEGLVNIGTMQAAETLEHAAETTVNKDLAGYCRRAAARIRKQL